MGRSALLFDLPFVSFLVSFALTLCLSICQAHTYIQKPAVYVCPYSVLVLVSLFSHVASILARGLPSRFRYNFYFYFYVSTPQPPLSLLLPFPSPSRNQFSSPFQGLRTTQSSSNIIVVILTQTPGLLTQHASSCHICRLIFEDRSKAFDLFTALSLINGSKNASRISSTC